MFQAPLKQTLQLGNRSLEVTYSVSPRSRRIRIIVSTEGVEIRLPPGVNPSKGENLLRGHAAWVLEKLDAFARKASRAKPPLPKDVILLHGKPIQMQVQESALRVSRASVKLNGDRLMVEIPLATTSQARHAVDAWLKSHARPELESAVQKYSRLMQVSPTRLTFRDQRSRWGSCSSRGTLSFNWRLIMSPPEVLNYVVIHELAHMHEPNHSPRFWRVVARFCPEYKVHRLWLKRNGHLLRT